MSFSKIINKNIYIVLIVLFLTACISLFFPLKYKEGFELSNINIKKIEIKGNEWFHLSKLKLFSSSTELKYNDDFTLDITGNPKIYQNNPAVDGFDKLFDNDNSTILHSGTDQNIVFTINIKNPQKGLTSLYIRNRQNCCQSRINQFTLTLYDETDKVVWTKKLDDSSLTDPKSDYSVNYSFSIPAPTTTTAAATTTSPFLYFPTPAPTTMSSGPVASTSPVPIPLSPYTYPVSPNLEYGSPLLSSTTKNYIMFSK